MSLDSQIHAVVHPDSPLVGEQEGNSMIVLNHISQMKMFGIRQGIELYPEQDDERGTRKKFIQQVWKYNKLDTLQDRLWELFLCQGQVLFYYRPNSKGIYDIHFYDRESFRAYYDLEGNLEKVMVRYSYYEVPRLETMRSKKWMRLTITADYIDQEQFGDGQVPGWDVNISAGPGNSRKRVKNSLGFVPSVVIKNKPLGRGQDGVGEFEFLRSQIDRHAQANAAIEENLQFFGNPILAATRSPSELTEVTSFNSPNLNRAHTMASEGGWYDAYSMSTAKSLPRHGSQMVKNLRLKKVIGNVHSDERFAFVSPPPVSADHARYVAQTREAIHFALGSIDETGVHANATAYEMKTVYGKVATTALKKATAIYEYGLCQVFENLIAVEEDLFRRSLANALQLPLEEVTDSYITQMLQQNDGQVPPGVFGLPPLGNREVKWRWTGPVFEDSPQDMQQKSIVVRNLQELGVRALDALSFLFPEKTEKEKQGMLSGGYPFRYLNAVAGTAGQMLGLYQQMLSLPSQDDPNVPMSAYLPVQPMIARSLETIFNELSYARPIEPSSPTDSPYITGGNAYQQFLSASAQSANASTAPTAGNPQSSVPQSINPSYYSSLYPALYGTGSALGTNPGIPTNPTPLQSSGFPANSAALPPELLQYLSTVNPYGTMGSTSSTGIPTDPNTGQPLPIPNPTQPTGLGAVPELAPEFSTGIPIAGSTVTTARNASGTGTATPELGATDPSGQRNPPIPPIPPDLLPTANQPGSIWQQLFPAPVQPVQPQPQPKRKRNKRKRS
jgi:hypothetical protein